MRKATLFLSTILLSSTLFAQSATTPTDLLETFVSAYFTRSDGTLGNLTVFRFSSDSLDCGPTCTILIYSFCTTIQIGCEEGFGFVPDGTLTGLVSANYLRQDQLMVKFEAVTNVNFENDICTSIDPIYGYCNGTVSVQDAV